MSCYSSKRGPTVYVFLDKVVLQVMVFLREMGLTFSNLIDNQAINDEAVSFIHLLLKQKASIAWCAHPLSGARILGLELAEKNAYKPIICDNLQMGSGFLDPQRTGPSFSLWNSHTSARYFLASLMYPPIFKSQSETISFISPKIEMIVLFDESSNLLSISETSKIGDGFFCHELYSRHTVIRSTGMLSNNEKYRL